MKNKLNSLIVILLLIVLGFCVYFNSFGVGFIWDDNVLVVENTMIRSPLNILKVFTVSLGSDDCAFYRPMQNLTYIIDFFLYKFDYHGYHFTNIILHIIVAFLLFQLLSILTKDVKLSFFVSILFLVCPLWVESVTYISGRADILMAVFILSSLIFFIKDQFIFSGLSFFLALLSKEVSLAYPFVLILYIYLFRKMDKKALYSVLLFFFISIFYGILRFIIGFGYNLFATQEIPLFNRVLFFVTAIMKYLGLIFLPFNQHMSYTVDIPVLFFDKIVLLGMCCLALLILLFFYSLKKDKIISFFVGWFLIFLLPQSGIFAINALFSEHFVYLSSIGIFLIFVYLLFKIKLKYLTHIVFYGYLLFFCVATIRYNYSWQNEVEFYKRIIKLSKNSFTAYNNLGLLYINSKDYDRAERLLIRSIEIKPDFQLAKLNLARVYSFKNDYKRAIGLAKGVIKENTNNYVAYSYLGNFYVEKGEFDIAEHYFNKGLELNQEYLPLWADLYFLYKLTNNEKEAGKAKDYIAKTDKFYLAEVLFKEAEQLFRENKIDEALLSVNRALEINQRNINFYNLRGLMFKLKGEYLKAYLDFEVCLDIDSRSSKVYNNLGNLFAIAGDFKNAEAYYKKAVSLNSSFADTYFNLGLLYYQDNQMKEAVFYFKKVLVLKAGHILAQEYLKKAENPAL